MTEEIHHISMKIPIFSEASAAGWFQILEANFSLAKITIEETKFYHALSALPPETVTRLSPTDLTGKNFNTLKTSVLALYERTKPEMFEKLISTTTMTGRPSLFLQEIMQVAAKLNVNDDLIRHKFIQALPSTISPVIAASKDLSLTQLGNLADELMPFTNSNIYQVQGDARRRSPSPTPRQSTNTSTNSIPVGIRPFSATQRPMVCRAHLYFANRARSCKPWCRWPNKPTTLAMNPSSRPSSPHRNPGN